MKVLDPDFDLERFFARLTAAEERVLLLDYDGTLAPFHADPRLALPYPAACRILREIAAAGRTRLVIVSGRRMEDLRTPLALLPHAEVWASHGWERACGGKLARRVPAGDIRCELDRARSMVAPLARLGARLEPKIASVALHWRGLQPHAAKRVRAEAHEAWHPFISTELALLPFDGGLELRARGRDKGDAVRESLSAMGEAACAYLGDDTTDEDAFKAIRAQGLGVLVRAEHRATQAKLWLSQPHEVSAFLTRWSAAAGARPSACASSRRSPAASSR